jgi:hypothetical protein
VHTFVFGNIVVAHHPMKKKSFSPTQWAPGAKNAKKKFDDSYSSKQSNITPQVFFARRKITLAHHCAAHIVVCVKKSSDDPEK